MVAEIGEGLQFPMPLCTPAPIEVLNTDPRLRIPTFTVLGAVFLTDFILLRLIGCWLPYVVKRMVF